MTSEQSSKQKWETRYGAADYEPNLEVVPFLGDAASRIRPCRALCLAAGAGRNAVYLAQQGFEVTAVDISPAGLERCAALARRRGVELELVEADLLDYEFTDRFGLITMLYYYEPCLFPRIRSAVEDKGHFLFQTFSVDQAAQDWGPSNLAFLAKPEVVLDAFRGWRIRHFEDGEIPVVDNPERRESAVRLLAQNPGA